MAEDFPNLGKGYTSRSKKPNGPKIGRTWIGLHWNTLQLSCQKSKTKEKTKKQTKNLKTAREKRGVICKGTP